MNDIIHPRSPRETMDGWIHLPRYIDKIRLHLVGRGASIETMTLSRMICANWSSMAAVIIHHWSMEKV